MTEQNTTQGSAGEGAAGQETPEVLLPKCPHCGENVPGLNVSTIILPTPQNAAGDMTFLLPCCPLCNKIITAQFVGYTPRQAGVARPPSNLWKPS